MYYKSIYTLSLSFLLAGCNPNQTNQVIENTKEDTITQISQNTDIEHNTSNSTENNNKNKSIENINSLASIKFSEDSIFNIDSVGLQKDYDGISFQSIQKSFNNLKIINPTVDYEPAYSFSDAIIIDSLKRNNAYQAYEEKLDLGGIKEASVFFVGTYKNIKGFQILIWGSNYSTYEACPYASAKYFFISTLNKENEIISTALIGEDYHASDAPYYSIRKTHSQIDTDGNITLDCTEKNGGDEEENEEPAEQVSKKKYQIKLNNSGIFYINT